MIAYVDINRTALHDQGKLEEAIATYRQAIQVDSKFARAYDKLGITLRNNGALEEALISCNSDIELEPQSDWVIYDHSLTQFALN
jgi:tetratricopeptide (TPR) repeat protein